MVAHASLWLDGFASTITRLLDFPVRMWRTLGRHHRACQTVLAALLEGLLPAIAPVLPHMAEDAWQAVPYPKPAGSVFRVS
jgi:isoleucyl-tRNA synthetase